MWWLLVWFSDPWDVEVVSPWQCGLGFISCCDLVTAHGGSCLTGSQAMAGYWPKRNGSNILAICHGKCNFGYCWQDCTDECSQFSSIALFGLKVTNVFQVKWISSLNKIHLEKWGCARIWTMWEAEWWECQCTEI